MSDQFDYTDEGSDSSQYSDYTTYGSDSSQDPSDPDNTSQDPSSQVRWLQTCPDLPACYKALEYVESNFPGAQGSCVPRKDGQYDLMVRYSAPPESE